MIHVVHTVSLIYKREGCSGYIPDAKLPTVVQDKFSLNTTIQDMFLVNALAFNGSNVIILVLVKKYAFKLHTG
ncbi:hypothetical protein C1N53_03150 [Pontibacter sp. SGAir0037]|nr:hypothetical protein C1N53_03150 [Pontibacter sp. SGAir0037]